MPNSYELSMILLEGRLKKAGYLFHDYKVFFICAPCLGGYRFLWTGVGGYNSMDAKINNSEESNECFENKIIGFPVSN